MPPDARRIPAPTRRQAMDWSLVLTSQGIEHGLDRDEAAGWTLTVAETDYEQPWIKSACIVWKTAIGGGGDRSSNRV